MLEIEAFNEPSAVRRGFGLRRPSGKRNNSHNLPLRGKAATALSHGERHS
jgi:hypothetical protein